MIIRKATPHDFDRICEIFALARQFMADSGNPTQWGNKNPTADRIKADIDAGIDYVCESDGIVRAVFVLTDFDGSYADIEDGNWLDDGNYGVIHRVASDGTVRGVSNVIMDYCKSRFKNLRGDTHADNKVMQNVFLRNGFVKCGRVYAPDGTPRIAYNFISE